MLYNRFKDAYERVNDIGNIKDRVMAIIKTKSVEGLRNLFDISNYNINDYIIETIQEIHGEYYKQRWYIAGIKRGHDVLCNYEPYYEDLGRNIRTMVLGRNGSLLLVINTVPKVLPSITLTD